MQPYRLTTHTLPHLCKATSPSRTLFTTPFFPHITSDLAPLFHLLSTPPPRQQQRFTPRFDVREASHAYELQGELPGLERGDVAIEFVDERTLVVRGRRNGSEEVRSAEAGAGEGGAAAGDGEGGGSGAYRKASVEEEEGEGDYVDAGADAAAGASTGEVATKAAVSEPGFRYWVSERAVGAFERRFAFPGRVDQEAVRASLRNGILSVVVPKIGEGVGGGVGGGRRIEIQ